MHEYTLFGITVIIGLESWGSNTYCAKRNADVTYTNKVISVVTEHIAWTLHSYL
jgi:hypothetical protein